MPQLMERRFYGYSRYYVVLIIGSSGSEDPSKSYPKPVPQPAAPAIARCTTERRMPQAEAWQLKERRATIQQRAVRHNIKGAPHKGAAAMSP